MRKLVRGRANVVARRVVAADDEEVAGGAPRLVTPEPDGVVPHHLRVVSAYLAGLACVGPHVVVRRLGRPHLQRDRRRPLVAAAHAQVLSVRAHGVLHHAAARRHLPPVLPGVPRHLLVPHHRRQTQRHPHLVVLVHEPPRHDSPFPVLRYDASFVGVTTSSCR